MACGSFDREPHVHAALGHLVEQHVHDLLQLEIVIGKQRELEFLCSMRASGALEVETVGDFLVGLLDRVFQLDLVDLGNDVE